MCRHGDLGVFLAEDVRGSLESTWGLVKSVCAAGAHSRVLLGFSQHFQESRRVQVCLTYHYEQHEDVQGLGRSWTRSCDSNDLCLSCKEA